MRTWNIGKFKITEVPEMPIEVGLLDGMIAPATPEVVRGIDWMIPDYANEEGQVLLDLHSYVVDTGEQVFMIDAGCGNGKTYPVQPSWSNLDNPFVERLAEAGYAPEDIDVILVTHLHLDHVGWCAVQDADGTWVPTFPRARLVVIRDEYESHLAQILPDDDVVDAAELDDEDVDLIERAFLAGATVFSTQAKLVQEESLQPIIDAGRFELVPANTEVAPGVRYEATPGHTAGHHSVRLFSDGAEAFITGDFIHHPMQIARPEWSSTGDFDPELSGRTRRAFFESCAGTDLLVMGTHFTGTGVGYIVEEGDNYRLVADKPV